MTPNQNPRLVEGPALLLAGLHRSHTCHSNAGIPAQWSEFIPHLGKVPGQQGSTAYGVIGASELEGQYEYLCGVEVNQSPDPASGLTSIHLPPRKYLVFEHNGPIAAIGQTWQDIWDRAIAAAGHLPLDGTGFERYDDRFDARTGSGIVELWVPVKP